MNSSTRPAAAHEHRPAILHPLSTPVVPADIFAASLIWELDGTSLTAQSALGNVTFQTSRRGDEINRCTDFELDGKVVPGGPLWFALNESAEDALARLDGDLQAAHDEELGS